MKIGVPKETISGENRVAMTPESAGYLQKLGYDCLIQSKAGEAAGFSDADYEAAGVTVIKTAASLWKEADIIAKVRQPSEAELKRLVKGKTLISFFNPGGNEAGMEQAKAQGANVIAMEMVPRISRAQKMDALSSMANIAGYRAVIEAGNNFGRFEEDQQDGAATGGYASVSSPEFREAQLAKFRELAPEGDIVITTALIPNREAPELWTEDMVAAMKPGSVIVDLAAEKGGNCKLTKADEKIVTKNGVTIIGYTDFPSRMAAQASMLYGNNIRHMMTDLTPEKDGQINHDMEDDVIRGSTVTFEGEITFPPPPPKIQAIAAKPKPTVVEKTPEEIKAEEAAALKKAGKQQVSLLLIGAAVMGLIGFYAPAAFMGHFIVFVLAVFVGFQVIWGVSHALHTPLMAVTNAISGIIIIGALLQVGADLPMVKILAAISIGIATINIVGGFMVTRRMLQMFQKS
ncbi:MAG: Re/Si-specific NAD(P)(+) transhydrogenase subunit alpha [Maritimibacter sp.]